MLENMSQHDPARPPVDNPPAPLICPMCDAGDDTSCAAHPFMRRDGIAVCGECEHHFDPLDPVPPIERWDVATQSWK